MTIKNYLLAYIKLMHVNNKESHPYSLYVYIYVNIYMCSAFLL